MILWLTLRRARRRAPPRGVGLMITKAIVDDLVYNEARNELVLIKYV
jgi:anti-sigma regulatory factor (Ser/Thr protein kinase)